MTLSLNIQIETKHIHAYLIELGLFRLSIREQEDYFYIVIGDDKNLDGTYFSSTIPNGDLSWSLRLDKSDLLNTEVTRGFFHNSSNHNLI